MKLNKSGQLLLVSAASLLAASLVTACSSLTVDFVYVTSAKAAGTYSYGEVDVFEINSESGAMRQIPTSPFPSGGRNPVAEAVSADYKDLYVVNRDDNTIVEFAIGNDGKIYPQNTINTAGIYPMATTVSGSNLFVLDTYYPNEACTTASPCSGSIAVYPIGTANALGSAVTNTSTGSNYWKLSNGTSDVIVPTSVSVTASGSYLYVSAYDATTLVAGNGNAGYIFGYQVNTSGVLTPILGSPWATGVGSTPSAIATDASSYVYVTDTAKNVVLGYSISAGALTALGSYATGNQPSAVVVDPSANYAYVTNAEDGTVTAYSISSGVLARLGTNVTGGTYTTGQEPIAMGIDPSKHHFLFTVNYLGNSVSGFELAADGTLINSQGSPSAANAEPTAVVAVPHQ